MNGRRRRRQVRTNRGQARLAVLALRTSHHLLDVLTRAECRISARQDDNGDAIVRLYVPEHRLEMGPLLLCVDTSGSMKGGAEAVAKATVLEAVRVAHAAAAAAEACAGCPGDAAAARKFQEATRAYDVSVQRNIFTEMKTYEKDRLAAQAEGDDLIIRAYKSKEGHLEIRTAYLKKTKQYSQKMLLNTSVQYRSMLTQDGGQK
jgi:hypothetical protein